MKWNIGASRLGAFHADHRGLNINGSNFTLAFRCLIWHIVRHIVHRLHRVYHRVEFLGKRDEFTRITREREISRKCRSRLCDRIHHERARRCQRYRRAGNPSNPTRDPKPWRVLRASDISTDMPTSEAGSSAFVETQDRAVRAATASRTNWWCLLQSPRDL